jgi:DNA-binding beta-propeller fold protein YncE
VEVSPDGLIVFADGSKRGQGYVLAALRASDGQVLWTQTACCAVHALLVSDDGATLYVGGQFGAIGTVRRHNVAALDPATGRVKPWNPRPAGYIGLAEDEGVFALAATSETNVVYLGGSFTSVGGGRHVTIAAVDAGTGRALDWSPRTQGGIVCALAVAPDASKLYVGDGCSDVGRLAVVKTARH